MSLWREIREFGCVWDVLDVVVLGFTAEDLEVGGGDVEGGLAGDFVGFFLGFHDFFPVFPAVFFDYEFINVFFKKIRIFNYFRILFITINLKYPVFKL